MIKHCETVGKSSQFQTKNRRKKIQKSKHKRIRNGEKSQTPQLDKNRSVKRPRKRKIEIQKNDLTEESNIEHIQPHKQTTKIVLIN